MMSDADSMTWDEKQRRAVKILNSRPEMQAMLHRTGLVRVAIPIDLGPYEPPGLESVHATVPIATFTIEDTALGERPMIEIDGRKEFVAIRYPAT